MTRPLLLSNTTESTESNIKFAEGRNAEGQFIFLFFFFPLHIASILDTRYRESNTRERKKSGSNVGWRETLDPSRGRRRFGKLEKDYPSREMIRYDSRIIARFERMKERDGLNWGPFVDSRSTLARSNNT